MMYFFGKWFYPFHWMALAVALLLSIAAGGCDQAADSDPVEEASPAATSTPGDNEFVKYASRFRLDTLGSDMLLSFPRGESGEWDTLLILPHGARIPKGYESTPILRVPVQSIAVLSTTHIGYINVLDQIASITGVADPDLIWHPGLRSRVDAGKVQELGMEQNLNLEALLLLKPDVILTDALPGTQAAWESVAKEAGIDVLHIADWMESHPLGRAEWIKVFGAMFYRATDAFEYFRRIERDYGYLRNLAAKATDRPTVITGLPFKDTWYVPGGASYFATLLDHAAASYPWSDNTESGSLPLSLEEIYPTALNADIWLSPGTARSQREIREMDSRMADFKPLTSGAVYSNYKMASSSGANDYWEAGVVNPQLILADLIHIIHPELLPQHATVYFERLSP